MQKLDDVDEDCAIGLTQVAKNLQRLSAALSYHGGRTCRQRIYEWEHSMHRGYMT